MKEDKIRKLLERFAREVESNNNRKILGMRSDEGYRLEKESLIEDTINQINNIDIAIEINKLKRGLK